MCRTKGKELYYLPGGKIEAGEDEVAAIIRECKEELNIDLVAETIEKFCCFEAPAYGYAEPRIVIMNCYLFAYTGQIQASAEIEDVFWACSADMHKLAPAAQVLMRVLNQKNLVV